MNNDKINCWLITGFKWGIFIQIKYSSLFLSKMNFIKNVTERVWKFYYFYSAK